jgi:hypothetical protein
MSMTVDKPVTVRLAQTTVRELMGLGIVDGSTLAEQIRKAAAFYIAARRSAPDLDQQVEAARMRQEHVLSSLSIGSWSTGGLG